MSRTASSSWISPLSAALVAAALAGDSPIDGPRPEREAHVAAPAPRASPATVAARPLVGLVPSGDPRVTASLADGIRLALDEARASGGPSLDLVVGAAAGRWNLAAAEAVRLSCDERALALVAPPERALAHPVAQAATRCGVPVISTSRAASVTAAGSRFVISVAPVVDAADDDAVRPPPFDADSPAAAAFKSAFLGRFGRAPDGWAAAGFDAGRVAVEAVRRRGLSRETFVAAARETAVAGAAGDVTFGALGRRRPARN